MTLLNSAWPVPASLHDLSAVPRVLGFRYDLLDRDESFIGTLDGVVDGSVRFDSWGAVRASGELSLVDTGQKVDWLNTRIRPVAVLESPEGSPPLETALGVYLGAAPVEEWKATGRVWQLEIVDKLSILDQDVVVEADGRAVTYSLPKGSNVVATVKSLIASTNEKSPAIVPDARTTGADYAWEAGTTKLSIINDLLRSADFEALWTDGEGNYRTARYVQPQDRTPIYELEALLEEGPRSVAYEEWTIDHDIYSIPNRMIAIAQGSGESPALSATVTNEDPDSPFSYQSRGRWITVVDSGVEAADDEALLSYAKRRMTMLSSVATEVFIEHPFLPLLTNNAVVRFANRAAGVDGLFLVLETEMKFDPLARWSSRMERVR